MFTVMYTMNLGGLEVRFVRDLELEGGDRWAQMIVQNVIRYYHLL